jgi:hypothetical protein
VYLRKVGSGATTSTTVDTSGVPSGTIVRVDGDLRGGSAVGDALVDDTVGETFTPAVEGSSGERTAVRFSGSQ